jgi:hypothetical protein
MIDASASYDTELAESARTPIYRVVIDGTISVCTSWPVGKEDLGPEILEVLSLDRRVEAESSRFPLSVLSFLLHDIDNEATDIVANGITGLTCKFYAGFWDISSSGNLVLMFTGIITEVEYRSGSYQVIARSPMAAANDKLIFDGAETFLTAAITSADTTLTVKDTAAFADPAGATNPWGDFAVTLNIDEEYLFPTGRTGTSFTGVTRIGANLYAFPPQVANSQSVAHTTQSVVREYVLLGDLDGDNDDGSANDIHPVDLLEAVLGSGTAKYELGSAFVTANATEFAAAKSTLGSNLKFLFKLGRAESAKSFMERELYLALAGYPRENNLGELGIKLFQSTAAASPVGTITDDDIIDFPRWIRNAERLINTVILYYDYVPSIDQFMSSFSYQDATLLAEHGRELPLIIYSKGIRSSYTATGPGLTWFGATAAFLTSVSQRWIARFGNKSPVFAVQTVFSKQLLEVGDDVTVTFSNVVDIDGGEIGIADKTCEIISMRHNFTSGLIDMELLAYPE